MHTTNLPWLVIEASCEGVLRYAQVTPSKRPVIDAVREIRVEGLPTFTDGLQSIERQCGISLRGRRCAITMAGSTNGDTLSMVRARWTITRAGLQTLFGQPVEVLNDVVARAWAAKGKSAALQMVRGFGRPQFDRTGRFVMIMVDQGVGAALIDVDRAGHVAVLETEAGHMDFAPASESELKLATATRGLSAAASYERLLMLDPRDPAWSGAMPTVSELERSRLQAEWLGRFAVNVMHAHGAWQGVILTGRKIAALTGGEQRTFFERAFTSRRVFSRLVGVAPVWSTAQSEAVLLGAAELLASSFAADERAVA